MIDAQVDDPEVAMVIFNGLYEQYSSLSVALDALGEDRSLIVEFVKSNCYRKTNASSP